MTFSPFYMGNHTTPFDDQMEQQSYTVAENWGGQINFMVPLDGSLVERCKAAADRQIEKMSLDYELVRVLKCAELQQKGFMLLPKTRVYHMCSDVIPISTWKKAEAKVLACRTPPKPWYKPWQKPKETCKMSPLSEADEKALAEVSSFQRDAKRKELEAKNAPKPTPKTTPKSE